MCKFLTKKVKFRRFQKNENRRKSVTGAKMHIFEKFKKGTLAAPHELLNPKKANDLDQPEKNGTAFKKVGKKKSQKLTWRGQI